MLVIICALFFYPFRHINPYHLDHLSRISSWTVSTTLINIKSPDLYCAVQMAPRKTALRGKVDLAARYILFPKQDADYVEAASHFQSTPFQSTPLMYSEALVVLKANIANGSKGVLCTFLFHSLLTFCYLTRRLSSNFIEELFVHETFEGNLGISNYIFFYF